MKFIVMKSKMFTSYNRSEISTESKVYCDEVENVYKLQ